MQQQKLGQLRRRFLHQRLPLGDNHQKNYILNALKTYSRRACVELEPRPSLPIFYPTNTNAKLNFRYVVFKLQFLGADRTPTPIFLVPKPSIVTTPPNLWHTVTKGNASALCTSYVHDMMSLNPKRRTSFPDVTNQSFKYRNSGEFPDG